MATIALQATWNEEADALSLVFVSGSAGTIVLASIAWVCWAEGGWGSGASCHHVMRRRFLQSCEAHNAQCRVWANLGGIAFWGLWFFFSQVDL